MPPSHKPTLTDGRNPPSSGRKLQHLFSSALPDSNKPLCRSIASFTRTLLLMNTKTPSDEWMNSPSSTTLDLVTDLPDSISLHPIDTIPPSALNNVSEKVPPVYRVLFLEDLKKSDFPGWTFAWDQPWECRWNQLLAKFLIKHWQNAYRAGALKAFHMEPDESSNSVLQLGVLHRSFVGKKDGVRLGRFSPQRKTAKKKSEKISKFRLKVACHLSPFMFPPLNLTHTSLLPCSFKNIDKTHWQNSQSIEIRWNCLI